MATFLQFAQLLFTLGPYLVPVWQQIVALIQAHHGSPNLPHPLTATHPELSDRDREFVGRVTTLATSQGGLAASAFNIGVMLQVWQYLRAHPELWEAVQTIIVAFRALQPKQTRKLGKKAAKKDQRTFALRNYLRAVKLPPVPDHATWSAKVPEFPMYLNDQIGDCAIAGPAHLLQVWSFNDVDTPDFTPSDDQVIREYMKVGGYDPTNPGSDNGCILLDVMNTWRRDGLCGHKIGAYVGVNPQEHDMVAAAIHLFGGLTIGLRMPSAWQTMQGTWKAPSRFHRFGPWAPDSWGGHCVIVVDYDETTVTAVTWGGLQKLSWNALQSYCDEAFAAISVDWLGPDGKAPNGFDTRALAADLAALH